MGKTNICPCPNLECPNHGNCTNCTSRHLRMGFLNYCGFHSILPFLEEVSEVSSDSLSAQKVEDMVKRQSQAYLKLMEKHNITEEKQCELRTAKSLVSDH